MNLNFLYKYRSLNVDDSKSLERIKSILIDSKLYFATPSAFNDPYDCKIIPSFPLLTPDVLTKFYLEGAKKYPKFSTYPTSLHERFVDHLINEQGMLENKNELIQTFLSILERKLKGVGVCCFSSKNDDILMWSHYASGHTGICLEFDVAIGKAFFDRAIKVDYEKAYPVIDYFKNEKWLQTILLTKAILWEYENEYRMLKYDGPGTSQFPEISLSGVILGCRITNESKKIITELVDQKQGNIKIKKARLKEYEFGLEIVEVS